MLTLQDVRTDATQVFGSCGDDAYLLRRVNDAIELLANKGEWNPQHAYVDVAATGRDVTAPTMVETPLGVCVDGVPALGWDKLFEFHVNGPGSGWQPCKWQWADRGLRATYKDLTEPARLVATVIQEADAGSEIRVFGLDDDGNELQTAGEAGLVIATALVPVLDLTQPLVAQIDRVVKARTSGRVLLSTSDWSAAEETGTLLADWFGYETNPQYRRILLSRTPTDSTVRIYFRRRTYQVVEDSDFIPLHTRYALVAMFRAIKAYEDDNIAVGLQHEANAVRWMSEKERTIQPPGATMPVQVVTPGTLYDEGNDDLGTVT
jgi:hypothetical protein